jgi:hypothetical protein
MSRVRIDKTVDKTRRGGLPMPTADKPSIGPGYGQRCSGCGDTIETTDEQYLLNIRGVALLRFHDVCYNAWANFSR